ncbi:MAG: hypothetical protein QXG10_05135 [Candidatus Hadarchaeales archaeon]
MGRLGGLALALMLVLGLVGADGGGSAENNSRAFVLVLEFPYIRGRVMDSAGQGIENATVRCMLENGTAFYTATDENGNFAIFPGTRERFRYTLIVNENHTGFNSAHPFRGFESLTVENEFDPDHPPSHLVVLGYDPFDLSLSPNSADLELRWYPVVRERRYEYRLLSTIYGSRYNVRLVGGHRIYTNQTTTDPNYYCREHVPSGYVWGGDYDYNTGSWVSPDEYLNRSFVASSGSEIGLHGALRNVRYRVERIVYDGHYRTYRAGYWTFGGYRIYYTPGPYYIHFCDYYVGGSPGYVHGLSVPPQTFTITESEYRELSRIQFYSSNGSFVRIDAIDYVAAAGSAEVLVSVLPKNGYIGSARLSVWAENGLKVAPADFDLGCDSSASIAVLADEGVSSGVRRVFVRAYDGCQRLIEENSVHFAMSVEEKPGPLTLEYLLSFPNSRIEVQVFSEHTGKALSGARVVMRLSNGATFASGFTDNQGRFVFVPSEWPLNVNLDVEVSYPKYVTKHTTVYTGQGGWKYASVYLNCGDFILNPTNPGYAKFYPDGTVKFIQAAEVNAQPGYPVNHWAGGDVSLTTTYSTYYFSYANPDPAQVDPSSTKTIKVYGYPKIEFANVYKISLTGAAGPPSCYVRSTAVGYSSVFEPR